MSYRFGLAALAATASFALVGLPAAVAETTAPSFAVQNAANTYTRLGFKSYERGNYEKAANYATKGAAKGFKKSRRAIAYTILCASLGQQNALDEALAACDAAIELSATNWQAVNNRGVINYLAGNESIALADFTAAAALPKGEFAQANVDLLAGIKLAASK